MRRARRIGVGGGIGRRGPMVRIVEVSGEQGLREAPALAEALAMAIAGGDVALDVGGLTAIDAAGLQVLIAAHRTAEEAGVAFGFRDPDQPVLRAALADHFLIGADGSALTPEHPYWTRAVTPPASEAA